MTDYHIATLEGVGGVYRTVLRTGGRFTTAATSANAYGLFPTLADSIATNSVNVNVAAAAADWYRSLVAADDAMTGLTTYLRIRGSVLCSNSSPGITVTFGLYPFTISSGNVVLGTVVASSTAAVDAATASPTNQVKTGVSSDFAFPADGAYTLGCTLSGTPSAIFTGGARLQVHNA